MTQVCLLGTAEVNLQYELLSRETARNALAAYDLREPFENALGVETVSLGAAVALLNDLDWYLTRFVDDALVREPSITDSEWLSRNLAAAIRNDEVDPDSTGRFLRIYGVIEGGDEQAAETESASTGEDDGNEAPRKANAPPRLVEPMLVARTSSGVPSYDLRDVDSTVVVRITESEFGA